LHTFSPFSKILAKFNKRKMREKAEKKMLLSKKTKAKKLIKH